MPLSRCTALAAAVLLGRTVGAQTNCPAGSCTVTATGTLTVGTTVSASVTSADTPLGTPNASDFVTGYTTASGPAVTVQANTPVKVLVSSGDALGGRLSFWLLNRALSSKPIGDLLWASTAAGPYTALTTSAANSVPLFSTQATAGTPQQIFYKVLWKWAQDRPGNYTLPVTFTVVAP